MTATTQSPPGANQFTIGATPAATAANLRSALTTAIGNLAATVRSRPHPRSAASNDFFSADAGNPPQRVAGPPFDTATSLTAGSSADTVIWYTGEAGSASARSTATARIDPSLVVSYGTRANEDGIRSLVQNVATLAAVQTSSSDPNAATSVRRSSQRLAGNLGGSAGMQTVANIEAELAGAQSAMKADEKHITSRPAPRSNAMLQQITASATKRSARSFWRCRRACRPRCRRRAILYQMSLVNYIK